MDKNLKKIKYQELFLSELRNSYFGEKKLEESLREMETKENMKKLAKALKNIWKQTDADVKSLEEAFPKPKVADKRHEVVKNQEIKVEQTVTKIDKAETKKKVSKPENLPPYQILTYDNLVELVDNLNTEQITEILKSASGPEANNHQYLTSLAEKLVKERDSRS
ncbi:DUF892 family protein [Dyadobacter subterraneus]|uniref:DUF892 family protein n=1 Tax=Dyadobacter subterraneus TaxID=2773304 RepID=A0ABR9WFU6_9BACT|nr:DUF892 family protein [Dyadobacter subterraneus]MBE9464385.1 DUF892 family protein [Dyadobacter subterraneus]